MKVQILICCVALLALVGCQRQEEGSAPPAATFGGGKVRYVGVGLYRPGRLWEMIARQVDPKTSVDPAASVLKDDDQIIVAMDVATGEIRQCGNLSGYCVRMNPWSGPAANSPVVLTKHLQQLEEEDVAAAASEAKVQAATAKAARYTR